METIYDLAIVGGGINGCGIARDAAGRGLKVYLCEQNDLASGTSSAATKLIHGGLRYLEHYKFRLVREALIEREILWKIAPHIIWPLRFVLPHHTSLRPVWMLRLGLFIYDHLGGRKLLPPTRTLDLRKDPAGAPLKDGYARGFEYSDCWVEDSRLVVLNAMDAKAQGARIETRQRLRSAAREAEGWKLTLEQIGTGLQTQVRAKILVNAAGPWVGDILSAKIGTNMPAKMRLTKGSHIVVKKLFDHDRCYIFQNADGRIIFAIPYEQDFTLIGTTDQDFDGDPAKAKASGAEISYLCQAASEYFRTPIRENQVVWTYAGVRPLYDDGASKAQEATRDYVLVLEEGKGAPLLSIFGGKITTYRKLAEAALDKLAPFLPPGTPWTARAALPGGNFPCLEFSSLVDELQARYPFLAFGHARRLARAYGTRAYTWLGDAKSQADLGRVFGHDLTEAEVAYLMAEEWACSAEDVLWRRSKLGLRMQAEETEALSSYMRAAGSVRRNPA